MIGYLVGGLLMLWIGIYDAVTFAYKKNTFGFKNPVVARYLWPAVWVVMGIVFIITGFRI